MDLRASHERHPTYAGQHGSLVRAAKAWARCSLRADLPHLGDVLTGSIGSFTSDVDASPEGAP
jgi:hypothetical protein